MTRGSEQGQSSGSSLLPCAMDAALERAVADSLIAEREAFEEDRPGDEVVVGPLELPDVLVTRDT